MNNQPQNQPAASPAPATTRQISAPLRMLIADDHALVRKGLRQVLMDEFAEAKIEEAANGQQVLALAERQPWDIILLDLTMPGLSGLDVLKQLKGFQPAMRV